MNVLGLDNFENGDISSENKGVEESSDEANLRDKQETDSDYTPISHNEGNSLPVDPTKMMLVNQ